MEIYADITDEGLQPFYTYTLDEIVEQYEYDGNRMPIDKVYVQYDEDEYYLEDPAEVEDDDQLLTEDEVKATIAKREAWQCQEDERQKNIEERNRAYEERMRKFEANHPILFKLTQGALELFGWFLCEGFLCVMCILAVALCIYCTYEPFAAHYGWPTFAELIGHSS